MTKSLTSMWKKIYYIICISLFISCNNTSTTQIEVPQWTSYEISIQSNKKYNNPYTDIDVWAAFINDKGDSLVRPAFWDGGNIWKIRFAPPDTGQIWKWKVYSSTEDEGLNKTGELFSVAYSGNNRLVKHGLLKMSAGKRNIVYADGTSMLMVGDTPWSLPYRATTEQAKMYAEDRQKKGFNTALLIAVQPDKKAEGPNARNTVEGFVRGFDDIPEGHLNKLNPSYFKTLDSLMSILHDHEIIPVFAPLAHGYGWKGKNSLGPSALGDEYARFVKYLLARYGSNPVCWLLSLDGHGDAPGVVPAGEMLEKWDAYKQPTGLHYNPCDDFLATWAVNDSSHCFHYNRKHQDAAWLDFQWAQTGHDGKHLYHKVEKMYDNKPTKAAMNGEATYEKMSEGKNGLGWWQGENAWNELMYGGTMGVVYGAVSLWQWKITPDEPGWEEWTNAPYSWKEALNFEGAQYVGAISRAFDGFDFKDMERRWDLTENNQPLLAKEEVFYISYLSKGGTLGIKTIPENLPYYWFDPVKGEFYVDGKTTKEKTFTAPNNSQPWVFIAGKRE